MRTKDFTARVKAAGAADGLAEGQFVALVSVFGNEDSVGDVVRAGAFTETLAEWAASGDPIPVIWSHKWGDPFSHIGTVIKATETLEGLEVLGQIDDLGTNATADQVYRLLKGRRVKQFSFAYDETESAWVKDDAHRWGGYWELRRLKLHEVGPCLVGANQETELLAAKAQSLVRGAKAGRVLSQANYDTLQGAYEAIGEVLTAATPEKSRTTDTDRAGQPGPAADGTQPSAQPDTPPAKTAADEDDGLQARIAQLVAAELAKSITADHGSTTDETTPDLRALSIEDVAKAAAASSRLRTELGLLELDLSLTD
ncbi:HK97 family phage prohead protease [Streptomyces sp. NPDC056500]|uniref:HK97 family phage prohead protease n=1 Tax=Streptomyces sp. NPDC056500 TaxID=3345840 RepID=UPI0036A92AC0